MLRALAFCCAGLLVAPGVAAAEWHFTPMAGWTFAGNTNVVDVDAASGNIHRQFGGAVTLVSGGLLGTEGLFVYTPRYLNQPGSPLVKSGRSYALMGNIVLTVPRRWTEYSLRPFVSGGLGLIALTSEDLIFPLDLHLAGFNIGGGAVGFLSKRTGLRFDLRYYSSVHGTDQGGIAVGGTLVHVRYMTASVGLVLRR